MPTRRAAVAGIHEYPDRLIPGMSRLQIKAVSAGRALADAGLDWADVDALYDAGETGPMAGIAVAEYFGITPRVIDTTAVGGSSYQFHAAHAMRDIAAGRARVALLTYGSTARSESRAIGTGGRAGQATPASSMETPYGLNLIANYALAARRHMHEHGTTPEQLAEIAVTTRAHAVRNPEAVAALRALGIRRTGEITVGDVLSSRRIADPLHLLECCLVSDGGGAVVIVAEDVARDLRRPPVWLLGAGEAVGYPGNDRDITTSAAARSGPAAFAEAGLTPADIDVAMVYDSFTITVLTILEDLGFAEKGGGGALVEGGRLRWDRPGAPALNTDGGGLSSNHPGMRGIFLLIEATRQLRGESTSQVPGARHAIAHGNGGLLGTRHAAGTVILGTD
ncbi:acetyl-CoA C-acetyltransferase [Actinomadura meyerae]|uniref:Acetyl-CoA C-acetyltransferase n=2 Tax=Actinomadura meyerae TaxID=240840 RepID=A0A239NUH8_9ACTN|nr:acetyl-CoA C-acetyltransferase [Actinomadura meyerae]